ncbi:hypothetical protein C922_02254 [Plasmodium inui San Antonio 1]|uniref:Uncharacterized protein n=1 Tax=Plasmodium inui San Antonio 1 TaxID=1237626 RepID=W7A8F5_9APIC|nr:hypothetical protein C922_02254 [Plasmodium inui San Antonio 1]EUD67548.1 hypothetical protein C922_02254 [Plasmodium inui San Antonio 1]
MVHLELSLNSEKAPKIGMTYNLVLNYVHIFLIVHFGKSRENSSQQTKYHPANESDTRNRIRSIGLMPKFKAFRVLSNMLLLGTALYMAAHRFLGPCLKTGGLRKFTKVVRIIIKGKKKKTKDLIFYYLNGSSVNRIYNFPGGKIK